jgi:hypothetical protein
MISLSKFFASGGEIREWKMGLIRLLLFVMSFVLT